jgi:TonB family protein
MTLQKLLVLVSSAVLALVLVLAGTTTRAQGKQADKDKDVTKPVLINKVNPTYPEEAKKDKIQGEVILEAMIGQDGKVLDVTVKKSPDDRLSKSAMEAVKQWTFQPAKDAKGNVIKVKTTLTVNFRLK